MINPRVSRIKLLFLFSFLLPSLSLAEEKKNANKEAISRTREAKFHYGYTNRKHTFKESYTHISAIYGLSWAIYPLTQPKVFREEGSFKKYRKNFGKVVFDRDEPFWNWFVHPLTGSQLYLYYRANGYNRIDSLGMSIISSTLFEFTVEIYTEPASVQDLYQTPVIGAFIGLGLENFSMYLLNSGNALGRFFGHVLNPSTLFWFYEGKVQLIPTYDGKKTGKLTLTVDF